jgi:hypothetical protein
MIFAQIFEAWTHTFQIAMFYGWINLFSVQYTVESVLTVTCLYYGHLSYAASLFLSLCNTFPIQTICSKRSIVLTVLSGPILFGSTSHSFSHKWKNKQTNKKPQKIVFTYSTFQAEPTFQQNIVLSTFSTRNFNFELTVSLGFIDIFNM